jgi:hypothetical protein
MTPNQYRCETLPILCSDCSELPGDCIGGTETMKKKRKSKENEEIEYQEQCDEDETWDRLTEGGYGSG